MSRLDVAPGKYGWIVDLRGARGGLSKMVIWEGICTMNDFVTAVRHRKTGEIRGYCFDRRTHAEIEADGEAI